ncbi:hypothetical protein [uncultured Bilophila sp.]|uniref:hypothetical protein n=1 Tax=uncultured Bilophila sp. TaxID=529385 RepID=UPI00260F9DD4|nr:hypothetical protein [uncultured Bilophila sp.]
MQQLSHWIAGFPGLIWSIDIPRSRLHVFNEWSIPGLDVPRLLKDARYRKKAVRREDYSLLMEFWDMLAARRPAAVTFRLTRGDGGPYILQGWPGEHGDVYYGFLKEAFLPAAYAADGLAGTCQMDIGGIGYPVFALDLPTQNLLIVNDAARALFAAPHDPDGLTLARIAPDDLSAPLLLAAHKALGDDVWAGTLAFSNAQRRKFSAKVRLTPCGGAGEGPRRARGPSEHPGNPGLGHAAASRAARGHPASARRARKPFSGPCRRHGRASLFRYPVPPGAGRRLRGGPRLPQAEMGCGTRL